MLRKVLQFLLVIFIISGFSFAKANTNSDIIAIRVLPNLQHKSVIRWYQDQGFAGSPQSLIVGGYPAIRDGKTVFVGATNVKDNNKNYYFDSGDIVYTNIFVITYNQGGSDEAINQIFSEILNNWKFNTNLSESLSGSCSQLNEGALLDCSKADGCWHFDNDYMDSSPNAYHGTKNGGATFSDGLQGQALTLPQNNSNSYIDIGNKISANNDQLTITADIFPTGAGSVAVIGGIILNKESDYEVARAADGLIMWAFNNPDLFTLPNWHWVSTGFRAPLNQWTKLVFIYGKNSVKTYANGSLVSDYKYAGANSISQFGHPLTIGARRTALSAGYQFFQGKIDEVKIFKNVINQDCILDSDCGGLGYCSSNKAILIRDTKRLADLHEMNNVLSRYKVANNGYCSKITSGTYVANRSVSAWPSWQQTLGAQLGSVLPVDPINKLGLCTSNDYANLKTDALTCWNEADKVFSVPTPSTQLKMNLPPSSLVYTYSSAPDGRDCAFTANFESGLTCPDSSGSCVAGMLYTGEAILGDAGGSTDNPATVSGDVTINCNLKGAIGSKLNGVGPSNNTILITASDGAVINNKNKIVKISASPSTWNWTAGEPILKYQSGINTKIAKYQVYAGRIPNSYTSNANSVEISATDSKGKTTTKTCSVEVAGLCGNSFKDSGETCDDGPNNKSFCTPVFGTSTYGMSSTSIPFCTYCSSASCQIKNYYGPYCGDSKISNNEKCDNGQFNDTPCVPTYNNTCSYCANNCQQVMTVKGGVCGNKTIEAPEEVCDDGDANGTVISPIYESASSSFSYCNSNCQTVVGVNRYCGDKLITDEEVCDDGNNLAKDGCNETCLKEVSGICGTSSLMSFLDAPSSDLCATGTPTIATSASETTWSWSCLGINGGDNVNCSAKKTCGNGSCEVGENASNCSQDCQKTVACVGLPAGSEKNITNTIMQTANGNNSFTPTSTYVFNDSPSASECRYKCATGYSAVGNACVKDPYCGADNKCVGNECSPGCSACPSDNDGDGKMNCSDNCKDVSNPSQTDADADGIGDLCDQCFMYNGACVKLTIKQGSAWSRDFYPYVSTTTSKIFYNYDTVNSYSSAVAQDYSITKSSRSELFGYIDATSKTLSLGVIHDDPNSLGGGSATFAFRGADWIKYAAIGVSDDNLELIKNNPAIQPEASQDNPNPEPVPIEGLGQWSWAQNRTDGGMIDMTSLTSKWTIEIDPKSWSGITQWFVKNPGSVDVGELIPDKLQPVTITYEPNKP